MIIIAARSRRSAAGWTIITRAANQARSSRTIVTRAARRTRRSADSARSARTASDASVDARAAGIRIISIGGTGSFGVQAGNRAEGAPIPRLA